MGHPMSKNRAKFHGRERNYGYEVFPTEVPDAGFTVCERIPELTSQITDGFRRQLISQGLDGQISADQTAFYEDALLTLNDELVYSNLLTPEEREPAQLELLTAASGLSSLFDNRLRLKKKPGLRDAFNYEGYFTDDLSAPKRIVFQHISVDDVRNVGKVLRARTQMGIIGIQGKTQDGRVITRDKDNNLRVSLRASWSHQTRSKHLMLSVDSGRKNIHTREWKIINPLSQAISRLKQLGQIPNGENEDMYTYHFDKHVPGTLESDGFNQFLILNGVIGQVLNNNTVY